MSSTHRKHSATHLFQFSATDIHLLSCIHLHASGVSSLNASILQGVATTLYAATAPELEGHSGAYLEDCRVKQPSKTARDPHQARRLWEVTEEQVAAAESPGGFTP